MKASISANSGSPKSPVEDPFTVLSKNTSSGGCRGLERIIKRIHHNCLNFLKASMVARFADKPRVCSTVCYAEYCPCNPLDYFFLKHVKGLLFFKACERIINRTHHNTIESLQALKTTLDSLEVEYASLLPLLLQDPAWLTQRVALSNFLIFIIFHILFSFSPYLKIKVKTLYFIITFGQWILKEKFYLKGILNIDVQTESWSDLFRKSDPDPQPWLYAIQRFSVPYNYYRS